MPRQGTRSAPPTRQGDLGSTGGFPGRRRNLVSLGSSAKKIGISSSIEQLYAVGDLTILIRRSTLD
jgi:hypothetical protein